MPSALSPASCMTGCRSSLKKMRNPSNPDLPALGLVLRAGHLWPCAVMSDRSPVHSLRFEYKLLVGLAAFQ